MHRIVEDHLEDVLSGALPAGHQVSAHLKECGPCREETQAMRAHGELLRGFQAPEAEPRAGFYARVLERIELQRPVSIWALFTESMLGRRVAIASMAAAMFLGVFILSSEQVEQSAFVAHNTVEMDPLFPGAGFTNAVMTANASDSGAVLMSLVSYQER